ncbi:MAG: Fe-S-containing protein, partial [Propionicimonas sp.]
GAVLAGLAGLVTALQLPEILLLTRGLAVSGASVLTSEAVLNLGGYLAGIGLAVAIAWTMSGAARSADAQAVRITLTAVLGVTMLSQVSMLARILLARRLIGLPRWSFQALAWTATHEWVFTVALVVACLLPVGAAWLAQRRPLPPPSTPAEGRLRRAAVLSRRRFFVAAGTSLAAATVAMTLGRSIADAEPELSPPEPVGSDAAEVWVELASIDDGHLHRHSYRAADGTEIRFITIRKGPSAFVACLDACEICGPSGYFERDGHVICKLCDVAMNIATIGFKGGCNPIPIDFTVTGGRLVIARQVLEDSTQVFA